MRISISLRMTLVYWKPFPFVKLKMDPKLLRICLKEYLDDLIANRKVENPKFGKMEHFKKQGIKYDTLKQMVKGVQKWTLHYFIETANSFSIPPDHFLAELIRRYEEKSKP